MNRVDPKQIDRTAFEATTVHLSPRSAPSPKRVRFVAWAMLWSLIILYGSVAVGPLGFHYVPLDPDAAWARFMATPYVVHGSDQQADWMANLLFLIPLGFTLAGAILPRRGLALRIIAAIFAFCVCIAFILLVKYLQLFFPPRTVTLNYIFAQSLGSFFGIILFCISRGWAQRAAEYVTHQDPRVVGVFFAIYAVALFLFILFPFDLTFTAADLGARLAELPRLIMSWPGGGRSPIIRLILVVLDTAATVPLGILAAVTMPGLSLQRIVGLGLLAMVGISIATIFDMSATPFLVAILYRTGGIAIGAWLTRRVTRRQIMNLRLFLARIVPALIPVYLLAVLFVNGILTSRWRTVDEALAALDLRGLWPFWHHYIVSKAQALESTVVEMIIYAPIGILISLRRGGRPGGVRLAVIAAIAVSLAVEVGRWFKPGLQPDFTNLLIAGAAAYIALRVMPFVCHLVDSEGEDRQSKIWRKDASARSPTVLAAASLEGDHRSASRSERDRLSFGAPLQWVVAASCLVIVCAIVPHYPIAPWGLAASIVFYCAALWRWPSTWLVVIPAILPTFDLTPWTGWSFVGEPDLFILATIGTLAIRAPARRQDFIFKGWPGRILLLLVCVYCANVVIGLALPGPVGGSDNPYLRPDNALRLAKGFIAALVLLPFFRARQRVDRNAVQMFGFGMITGLTGVCLAAVVERALFPGLFDFTSDYRIVATFSSMHLGGGHIGAYIAMALPFLIACCIRPGLVGIGAVVSIALVGGYTLVVTYARTAYVAALVGLCTAFVGWVLGLRQSRDASRFTALLPALILTVVSAIVVAGALGGTLMPERLETVADDLGTREGNWIGGLGLRDNGAVAALVGMGLGTYPRIALSHSNGLHAPTNFLVRHEGDNSALSLHAGSSTYLTQRVPIEPDQSYKISLKLRSPDGEGKLSALLCENMLLYSVNCRSVGFEAAPDGTWRDLTATLSSVGLREHPLFGLIRRPVELSLSDSVLGSTIEIENVRLVSPHGLDIVANGDFGQGMSRWYFTDDDHLAWRIKNQYLMTLFECGALGLGVLLLTAVGGIVGAVRSVLRGNLMAAAIAASLVAFLCSSAFDYLLEVPRLATLFYLICFIGLDYGATQRDDPSSVRATT